jgi:hypothetical protein
MMVRVECLPYSHCPFYVSWCFGEEGRDTKDATVVDVCLALSLPWLQLTPATIFLI